MTHDLRNRKIDKVTLLEPTRLRSQGSVIWLCSCECGTQFTKAIRDILATKKLSHVGCKLDNITLHPLYEIWKGIKFRTSDLEDKRYGGRGITMSEEWKNSFEKFCIDMGPRPSLNYSVDRKDNNGNYEKDNCKWATPLEQSHNSTKGIRKISTQDCLKIYDLRKLHKAEILAEEYGVTVKTIRNIWARSYSPTVTAYCKQHGKPLVELVKEYLEKSNPPKNNLG